MFSISFRKHRKKKRNNFLTFIIKMKILFARAIITWTERASSVSLSSFRRIQLVYLCKCCNLIGWVTRMLSAISYSGCRSSTKCDVRGFGRKLRCKRVVFKIPEKTKMNTFTASWLQKLENIEKGGACVNNCKFPRTVQSACDFVYG